MRILKQWVERNVAPRHVIHARALSYHRSGPPEIRLLRRLCQRDKLSLDIGANVGVFTYFMLRHSAGVVAYEPNPDLARQLERTFGHRMTVIQAGLSDRSGSAVLKIPRFADGEFHGLASLSQDFEDALDVREVTVPIRRLDDEGHENVGFVKIDVEQHERQVLDGAMALIESQAPNILLEVSPLLYEVGLLEYLHDLLELGYHGFFSFGGRIHTLQDYDRALHNDERNLATRDRFLTNVILTHRAQLFDGRRAE